MFFQQLHQKLVKNCYGENTVNEDELSVLIHHIIVKPSRIRKITEFLKKTTIREIKKYKKTEISMTILLRIYKNFFVHSSMMEKNIFIIIYYTLRYIKKEENYYCSPTVSERAIFENNKCFLELVNVFFSGVMKTFDSEKVAIQVLKLLSQILSNSHVFDQIEYEESEQNEQGANNSSNDELSNDEEYKKIENETIDMFFVYVLEKLFHINDLFHKSFENKFIWVFKSLLFSELNIQKKNEILYQIIKDLNIVNIRPFLKTFLKYSCYSPIFTDTSIIIVQNVNFNFQSLMVVEINRLFTENVSMIAELTQMENESCSNGNKNLRHENDLEIQTRNYTTENYNVFIAQGSENINDPGGKSCQYKTFDCPLKRDDPLLNVLKTDKYRHLFALLKIGYTFITCPDILVYNTDEITRSFSSLIKHVAYRWTVNFQAPKMTIHTNPVPSFITNYIRTFLSESPNKEDLLYHSLLKAYANLTLKDETDPIKIQCILNHQEYVLSELISFTNDNQFNTEDRFINLLIQILIRKKDLVDKKIYEIIDNIIRKNDLDEERAIAILCKLRFLYFHDQSNYGIKVIETILIKYKNIHETEGKKTLLFFKKIDNDEKGILKEFLQLTKLDCLYNSMGVVEIDQIAYKPSDDYEIYQKRLGSQLQTFASSFKSSKNMETFNKKRKTKLRLPNFFV